MTPATLPLWRYGLLGAPLAFVSLPLYVTLPYHYAQQFGVPLAALGAVLLATRAADALVDPLIGRWVDTLFRRGSRRAWGAAVGSAAAMALGFAALWLPPAPGMAALAWLAGCLVLTYAAYSVVGVVHQTWGARWGGTPTQRARIVAAREGAALVGVLVASVLPLWVGAGSVSVVLAVASAFGLAALHGTASPTTTQTQTQAPPQPRADVPTQAAAAPWSDPSFRALIVVFVVNGMASAIPATLLPFFVADVLQAQQAQPWLLALYFVAAAIGLPLWVRVVRCIGLAPAWRAGMLLAVAAFALTPTLGSGDVSRLCTGVRRQRPGAGRRPGSACRAARRRGARRRPGGVRRRPLFRLVDLCQQAQPGAGRRRQPAAAGACRLPGRAVRAPPRSVR